MKEYKQKSTSSENSMVTLTPEIKRNNNTQTLMRRGQVRVSRLKMGYTLVTQGHRLDFEPPPECGDCGCRLTVNDNALKFFFCILNDFVHRFILDRTFVDFTVSLLILPIYIVDCNSKMVKSTVNP
jgi:hypothetical protein